MAANSHGHGNSPAAWTGVIIALIGFCLGGVFTVMAQPWLVLASVLVVGLGGVAALVMRSMGLGAEPVPQRPAPGNASVPGPRESAPAEATDARGASV
ncbi:hypothetical protein FNQ90_22735 [Streptomyces alkaliphilus]|uniref:Uncharacterized protein n=1 Tax=Streptomyces alkaliphilus TaxID=1472722 RepID=A0A7W3THC7_9ACTN|nr:HGxxPAAW family protein [Streptomyces alkaliphilus]MBB0246859.1 hypothetical protein [Streptomyces alkaliphilus]